jgi:hypothetical protein
MPEFEPYDGLSSDEVKSFQDFTKWSGARVADCHQSLIRLVDKVRAKLEAHVDRHTGDGDWIPSMDWSLCYRTTLDGGAKLIAEYYRRQAKNPAMGLTDEQLEQELQKAALALVDSLPLDEMERLVRRRRYVDVHGEQAKPPGQRAGRPPKRLAGVLDVEEP